MISANVTKKDLNINEALKANNESVKKSILKLCLTAQGIAKSLAPVDTGLLRNSISYKTYYDNDGNLSVIPKRNQGFIGTNVEYAVYQEFGTRNNVKPQPFLTPAILALKKPNQQKKIAEITQKTFEENLKKVKK